MKRIMLTMGMVVLLLAGSTSAFALEGGVRGYYWFPSINGEAKVTEAGLEGTKFDIKDDLDMSDEYYPIVEAFVGIGDHHLSASYFQTKYEGDTTLTRTINFNGEVFNVGDRVESELSYRMIDAKYRWDLIDLENFLAGGSLGPMVQLKYIDGKVRLKTTALDVEETFSVPIPMVGFHLHVGLLADIIEFRVQAAGMGYSGNSIIDGLADISYTPFPFLDIHAGYRGIWLKAEADDNELTLNTAGPYAALTISF